MQEARLTGEYVDAFRRRSAQMAGPHGQLIDEPGVIGVVDRTDLHRGRLLVTDDRAAPILRQLEGGVHVVVVLSAADECRQLIAAEEKYAAVQSTAMVCADLSGVPDLELPAGLSLRRVRRLEDDAVDGVSIEQAAAACLRAEPDIDEPLEKFVAYLRSLPSAAHLFAAIDDAGEVRATAASGCFGADVNAFFVSTDLQWRGRGVATAITAMALREAAGRGGRRACLDASDAGRRIYERIGFVAAGAVTMFMRTG